MEYQKPSGKKNELLDDLHCCCCCFVSFIAHLTMTVQLGLEILTWIAWTVLNWNELYHTVPLDTRIYCCSHIQSIVNSEAQTDRHEAKSPALLTFVGHFGGGRCSTDEDEQSEQASQKLCIRILLFNDLNLSNSSELRKDFHTNTSKICALKLTLPFKTAITGFFLRDTRLFLVLLNLLLRICACR